MGLILSVEIQKINLQVGWKSYEKRFSDFEKQWLSWFLYDCGIFKPPWILSLQKAEFCYLDPKLEKLAFYEQGSNDSHVKRNPEETLDGLAFVLPS